MSDPATAVTFEQLCGAVDAQARSAMSTSDSARLIFDFENTNDGIDTEKQVGRWTFNGRKIFFNKMSQTGAIAGVESASNPQTAPTRKLISIHPEGVEDGVRWIRWLTTEAR